MPSHSGKQHKFMEAIAHNPAFAKKVGVPQSVGQDFSNADKGKKFSIGGTMNSKMKMFEKSGKDVENGMKEGSKADMAMDKKQMMKMARGGGIESRGKTQGKMIKMAKGGMARGGMADGGPTKLTDSSGNPIGSSTPGLYWNQDSNGMEGSYMNEVEPEEKPEEKPTPNIRPRPPLNIAPQNTEDGIDMDKLNESYLEDTRKKNITGEGPQNPIKETTTTTTIRKPAMGATRPAKPAEPMGAGAGRGRQGGPTADELANYSKEKTQKRQAEYERAQTVAATPAARAEREKQIKKQALEEVHPESYLSPGVGLKSIANLAKGLANRGPKALREYVQPLLEGSKRPALEAPKKLLGMKKGGSIKKMASGGSVSSASNRADGIAQRGKTRGKMC